MQIEHFVFEPLLLFQKNDFLVDQRPALLPNQAEVITELARAMTLENDRDLPAGYVIWSDAVQKAQSVYFALPETRQAEQLIEEKTVGIGNVWDVLEDSDLADSEFAQFWEQVSFDMLEQLKSIAVAKAVLGDRIPTLFEDMLEAYTAGYYPCGLRSDGRICALDPSGIDGFQACKKVVQDTIGS